MARVTVEDCIQAVGNHFALAVLGAQRARALAKGAIPLVQCDNNPGVTALREIAAGKVSAKGWFSPWTTRCGSAELAPIKSRCFSRTKARTDFTFGSASAPPPSFVCMDRFGIFMPVPFEEPLR